MTAYAKKTENKNEIVQNDIVSFFQTCIRTSNKENTKIHWNFSTKTLKTVVRQMFCETSFIYATGF